MIHVVFILLANNALEIKVINVDGAVETLFIKMEPLKENNVQDIILMDLKNLLFVTVFTLLKLAISLLLLQLENLPESHLVNLQENHLENLPAHPLLVEVEERNMNAILLMQLARNLQLDHLIKK